jgi:hypothetical protein
VKDCVFQTSQQMVRLTPEAKFESSKAKKWVEIFNTLKNSEGLPSSIFTGLLQFKNRGLIEFFHKEIDVKNLQQEKIINAIIPELSNEQESVFTKIANPAIHKNSKMEFFL